MRSYFPTFLTVKVFDNHLNPRPSDTWKHWTSFLSLIGICISSMNHSITSLQKNRHRIIWFSFTLLSKSPSDSNNIHVCCFRNIFSSLFFYWKTLIFSSTWNATFPKVQYNFPYVGLFLDPLDFWVKPLVDDLAAQSWTPGLMTWSDLQPSEASLSPSF